MRRAHLLLVSVVLSLPWLAACPAAPRARPVKMGPVDTGAESVEAVRRQLQGTWELVSLDLYPAGGQKVTPQASGRLEYDQYGNLSMTGTINGDAQVDPSVLNLTGRATIDPPTHTIRFGGVAAASADAKRLDPTLDAAHVRYYEFDGALLRTTVKNSAGATTATATWRKVG